MHFQGVYLMFPRFFSIAFSLLLSFSLWIQILFAMFFFVHLFVSFRKLIRLLTFFLSISMFILPKALYLSSYFLPLFRCFRHFMCFYVPVSVGVLVPALCIFSTSLLLGITVPSLVLYP